MNEQTKSSNQSSKTCATCGKLFESNVSYAKYCSSACRTIRPGRCCKIYHNHCQWCHQLFTAKTKQNLFCSPTCREAQSQAGFETCSCVICQKTFAKKLPFSTVCSQSCRSLLAKRDYSWEDGYRIPCEYCGDFFKSNQPQAKLCSDRCREAVKAEAYKSYTITCCSCQKTFESNQKNQQFCSTDCRKTHYAKLPKKTKQYFKTCDICQSSFTTNQSHARFCSDACRSKVVYESRKVQPRELLKKECPTCKKTFTSYQKQVRFCSADCRSKFNYQYPARPQVKKHPKQRELDRAQRVVTELIERATNSENWSALNYRNLSGFTDALKDKIKERDQDCCQVCGEHGRLEVHHIVPQKLGGDHHPDNLITLCISCHRAIETRDLDYAIRKCQKNVLRTSKQLAVPDYHQKYLQLKNELGTAFQQIQNLLDEGGTRSEVLMLLNDLLD